MKNNPRLPAGKAGMTLIVKTVARLTFGVIFAYGLYIATETHSGPGSGFSAGVIIALSLILLMLAFGKEKIISKIDELKGLVLTSVSGLIFLFITARGLSGKAPSETVLLVADLALALMVGAGLFVVFLTLVLFMEAKKGQ